MTKTKGPSAQAPLTSPLEPLLQQGHKSNLIQWPSRREIQQVSARLQAISQLGIRSEAQGDYFTSGELAYQMKEIIEATAELLKRARRMKG